MKIAFFGTYFYNFEKIIHNSMKEANGERFYLFTDKKSYTSLFKNILLIRNEKDYKKIPDYIKNYKNIDKKELDIELKNLYHPYHVWSGSWIKVIINDFNK